MSESFSGGEPGQTSPPVLVLVDAVGLLCSGPVNRPRLLRQGLRSCQGGRHDRLAEADPAVVAGDMGMGEHLAAARLKQPER
jgi:hypothetical protein